jgi:predicted Zn-dependent protease
MRPIFPLLALLTLVACAAPTTERPGFTEEELRAEQAEQAAAVKAAHPGAFDDQKEYSDAELTQMVERLKPIAERVEKASGEICTDMNRAQCSFEVVLDASKKGLNAHADGQNVVIYPPMIEFATNDNQLAFVIAHEFAHSIMSHVASTQKNVAIGGILGTIVDIAAQSQGINTQGQIGKLGAHSALMKYSPAFENEADYVGLYILARAGYKIEDAPGFWRQMSMQVPQAVYATGTHPNNPSRTLAMQNAVKEIQAKKAEKQPLLPNIKPKK